MKRYFSMAAALALAALLTACAHTVADTRSPAYRTGVDTEEWHGNVSTTDDGRVNGTNEKARREWESRRARHPSVPKPSNTDAMGAGMEQ